MRLFFVAIVFVFCACENKNQREIVFTKDAPRQIGPYSQAVKCGELLFVSGQIGIDPGGILDTSSIQSECHQTIKNIGAILKAAGTSYASVLKTSIFTTRIDSYTVINKVYDTYFPKDPPARETIGVKRLPKNARVEISVIAQVEK